MAERDISQVWLDRVKVAQGREIHHDTTIRGLALRVSHTGKKVWQVTYRMPGSRQKHVYDLGPYSKTHLGIAEARKRAQALLEGVQHGIDPKAKPPEPEAVLTLNKLADAYITRYAKATGKKTWDRDKELLDRHVLPKLGERAAVEIRKRELIELLEGVARVGVKKPAPIAANRTLAVLKTMYKWANRVDLLEGYDPAYDIPKLAPENRRDRVLSDDEIRKFWATCDGLDKDGKRILTPLMSALFKLRLITGQRGGELESMRWQDIDGDWWNIPKELTKPKRAHRVPFTPMALAIIKEVGQKEVVIKGKTKKCECVFPNPKTGLPISNPQKAADRLVEESGIDFVLHDLRRTVATGMAKLGIDTKTIGRVLNHSEQGVTETVYVQYQYDREKREALEMWAGRLQEILQAKTS